MYNFSLAKLSEDRKNKLQSVAAYKEDLDVMQLDTYDSQEAGLSQETESTAPRMPDIEVPVMGFRLLKRPTNVPLLVFEDQQLLKNQSGSDPLVGLFREVKDNPALRDELLTSGWLLGMLKGMSFKSLAKVPTVIFNYLFNRGNRPSFSYFFFFVVLGTKC